jgi:putative endonuclease
LVTGLDNKKDFHQAQLEYLVINMYYVYILFSEKDKQLYTGYSDNLRSRFKAHTNGFVKSTKDRRPLKLIYYEAYAEDSDARRREKYLKGGNGRDAMKIQLQDGLSKIEYKNF